MKNLKISILFSIIVLLLFGCKEQPPEPKKNDIIPDKREYIWTVDTLYYHPGGQTLLTSLWGSSSTNVYAVGHDAHAGTATMWHFNGTKWSIVGLLPAYGGQIEGPYSVQSIYGFDSTNIYACGDRIYQTFSSSPPYFLDSSFIIHFDGVNWKEVNIHRTAGFFTKINSDLSGKLYFFGYKHYYYMIKGAAQLLDSLPIYKAHQPKVAINITGMYDESPNRSVSFFNVHDNTDGSEWNYQYKKEDNVWSAVDSFSTNGIHLWGIYTIWSDEYGNYYSGGDGIFQRTASAWIQIFRPGFTITKLWGTSNENIFALSVGGPVYHYNGIDWSELSLPKLNGFGTAGIWGTTDEVFISAYDGNKTIMFHGK